MTPSGDNSSIAYRDSATNTAAGSSTASFSIPSTVQVGDFLLLRYQETIVSGASSPGTPSGWTYLDSVITSSATLVTVYYWKFAVSGDAGSTGTLAESSSNGMYVAAVDAYSGTDPVSPIHAWALAYEPGTSATHYAPTVNITTPGCWLLEHASDTLASGTEVMVPPSSTLTQRSLVSGSGGSRSTMTTADSDGPVPEGQFGSDLWTSSPSNSTATATTGTVALAPASADASLTGFVTAASVNSITAVATATMTVPAGVLPTDIAVMIVSTGAGATGHSMSCASSGGLIAFTQLFPSTGAHNAIISAGILTGVTSGETLTISWVGATFAPTILAAWYRGYTLPGYTLGTGTVRPTTAQTSTAVGITTPEANDLVICAFMDRAASVGTPPYSTKVTVSGEASFLDGFGCGDSVGGCNGGTAIASFIQSTAGATTDTVATFLGGSASLNGFGFQISFPAVITPNHATVAWF